MKQSEAPEFLGFEILEQEIDRYSYRPGWELEVFNDPWEGPCLYVRIPAEDASNPGEETELRIRSVIPPIPDAAYFGHWLLWRLIQIESHEAREFLKIDGVPLFDPHDPIEPDPETNVSEVFNSWFARLPDDLQEAVQESIARFNDTMRKAVEPVVRAIPNWAFGGPVQGNNYAAQVTNIWTAPRPARPDEARPLANVEIDRDGTTRYRVPWTAPRRDAEATEGSDAPESNESTVDNEPQFVVKEREKGLGVWDRAGQRWASPMVFSGGSFALRETVNRFNRARRVFWSYADVAADVMAIHGQRNLRWQRERRGENRWHYWWPDNTVGGTVSPYDHRMFPGTEIVLDEEEAAK